MNAKLTTALLLCGAILARLWIVAQLYTEARPLGGMSLPLDVDSLKAREIMEGVLSDIDASAGKVKPHDDMTIVVVKVM